MDLVGKHIGRYEVTGSVGVGAMAEVFTAYDPDIERTVALKMLKEEHCVDEEHIERFLREGRAAGALTHPNIVTIHDVGTFEQSPYIMMELLEGHTLSALLASGAKLPAIDIVKMAMQIAEALDYAHDKGVVHRDVKPDNIMVGDDGSIKIADFGIARVDESAKDSTQAGMILGTPRYMSPEQASGEAVDGRSDLFSLGVILYEMITGQKAFDADSMATLIMQIVQKDPPPIRKVVSGVPAGLQNIVNRLLAKKPSRRFQTGREVYDALARELRLLEDDAQEKSRYLPLQVKWTLITASVVVLVMAISSVFVLRAQGNALEQQAIDSGSSLAKFIAVQAAVPVLGEDWITLEFFVQDASARETFDYLVVSDHQGIVRSATNLELVGQSGQVLAEGDPVHSDDDIVVTSHLDERSEEVFNFNLPILFRETRVGTVDVGINQQQLNAALDTSLQMLLLLAVAMVGSVAVAVYIFNQLVARNLSLATQALWLMSQGKFEARISRERTDEFGDLFDAFNTMADHVQKHIDISDPAPDPELETKISGGLDISGIDHVDDQTIVQPSGRGEGE